jgi:hypothetical protein
MRTTAVVTLILCLAAAAELSYEAALYHFEEIGILDFRVRSTAVGDYIVLEWGGFNFNELTVGLKEMSADVEYLGLAEFRSEEGFSSPLYIRPGAEVTNADGFRPRWDSEKRTGSFSRWQAVHIVIWLSDDYGFFAMHDVGLPTVRPYLPENFSQLVILNKNPDANLAAMVNGEDWGGVPAPPEGRISFRLWGYQPVGPVHVNNCDYYVEDGIELVVAP